MANIWQMIPTAVRHAEQMQAQADAWATQQRTQLADEWAAEQRRLLAESFSQFQGVQAGARAGMQEDPRAQMYQGAPWQQAAQQTDEMIGGPQNRPDWLQAGQQALFRGVEAQAQGGDVGAAVMRGLGTTVSQPHIYGEELLTNAGMDEGGQFEIPTPLPGMRIQTPWTNRQVLGTALDLGADPLNLPAGAVLKPARALQAGARAAKPLAQAGGRLAREVAEQAPDVARRLATEEAGELRLPFIRDGARKGDLHRPVYYHVVGDDWQPGDQLLSMAEYERRYGESPRMKWDIAPEDYADADVVSLHDNLPEARDFQEEYGGRILQVESPPDEPLTLRRNGEGYPVSPYPIEPWRIKELGASVPGGLTAGIPQQPGESDEDYQRRVQVGMALAAGGMAMGAVKNVGKGKGFARLPGGKATPALSPEPATPRMSPSPVPDQPAGVPSRALVGGGAADVAAPLPMGKAAATTADSTSLVPVSKPLPPAVRGGTSALATQGQSDARAVVGTAQGPLPPGSPEQGLVRASSQPPAGGGSGSIVPPMATGGEGAGRGRARQRWFVGPNKGAGFEQFWNRTVNVIEHQGPAGKQLAGLIKKTRDTGEVMAGGWIANMPTVRKLSKVELDNFVDVVQGLGEPRTEEVMFAANEWDVVRKQIHQMAQAAGLDIGMIENYFPRIYDPSMFKDRNKWGQAVEHLVKTGQAADVAEAEQILRRSHDVIRNRRYGNLELPREVDLPGYERTREALFGYVESAAKRIASAHVLGKEDETAMRLITKIANQGGDASAAKNLFDIATGAKQYGEIQEQISRTMRAWNVITKMGLGALTNATQSLNTATVVGGTRTLLNTPKAMFNAEAKDFALRIGATLDGVINDVREGAGFEGKLGSVATPGFNKVEKFNRTLAAWAGREYAMDLAKQAASGKEWAVAELDKLGLSGAEIAQRGSLTLSEQAQAGRNIVERTQFKVDPQDLPGWASSPWGKLVMQFRTFAYNQTAFIGREIIEPATKGNVKPLLRFLIYGLPVGAATVEAQNLIRNRPSEEDPVQQIRQWYQRVGGLGVLGDLLAGFAPPNTKYLPGERYALQAAGTAFGPSMGTFLEGAGSVATALQGKPEGIERWALKQVPVVGPTLKNTILPYKPGGRSGAKSPGVDKYLEKLSTTPGQSKGSAAEKYLQRIGQR